jgi:predicted nucleotidyltransferase
MAAQTKTSLKLTSREKKAVREFLSTVRLTYGEEIHYSAVFGSRVHGDSLEDSDIDILLIVADDHWEFQQAISKISSGIALKYDVTLDVRIISKSRWQYYAEIQAGLYLNISKESVPFNVRTNRMAPAINKAG